MTIVSCDIESFSELDLTEVGVYAYAEHPSTCIYCLAYAIDDGPVRVWVAGEAMPADLAVALFDGAELRAWNANFERVMLNSQAGRRFGFPATRIEDWRCTMVLSAYNGLPKGLDDASKALGLSEAKDKEGAKIMRQLCQPRRPTKKDPTTEWEPHGAHREMFEKLYAYCAQDVAVERAIHKRLPKMPDIEQRLYWLDQEINDRGIRVDLPLVNRVCGMIEQKAEDFQRRAIAIAGVSTTQRDEIIKWCASRGVYLEGYRKDDIANALKKKDLPPEVREVLEIRRDASRQASGSKFYAAQRAVSGKSRLRGMFAFAAAVPTMRWGGRLVQLQNLSNKGYPEQAPEDCMTLPLEGVEMLYGDAMQLFGNMTRAMLVPKAGHRFITCDFSAIEGRVLAWLAGEQWALEVYRTHGKVYEATASQMFGLPFEEFVRHKQETGKHHPLRAKGKVASLACIAADQLVLTDHGLIPIQHVTRRMMVWDGVEFVEHGGVVFQGMKETLTYDGLEATPDHLVWVDGQSGPIPFGYAAASGARLHRPDATRPSVWQRGDRQPGAPVHEVQLEGSVRRRALRSLWARLLGLPVELDDREKQRVSGLLQAAESSDVVIQASQRGEAAVHEPELRGVAKLRRAWHRVSLFIGERSRCLGFGKPRLGVSERDRPYRHERSLRAWESTVGHQEGERGEPKELCSLQLESGGMAVRAAAGVPSLEGRHDPRGDHRRRLEGGEGEAQELARNPRQVAVYDILNCGPRNRFIVNGALVHNCGYGGSTAALVAMGALKEGLSEEELPALVKQWRDANPNIVQSWYDVDRAMMNAVRQPGTVHHAAKCAFKCDTQWLMARLPSGRVMRYWQPRIEEVDKGWGVKPQITYMGERQLKGTTQRAWCRTDTYGARAVENLTQGLARDCLREAMLRLVAAGYGEYLVGHVHDEVILEVPYGFGSVKEVEQIMSEPIEWAPGLPLAAAGEEMERYAK